MPQYFVNSRLNPGTQMLTVHLAGGCGDVVNYSHLAHWLDLGELPNVDAAVDQAEANFNHPSAYCRNCPK